MTAKVLMVSGSVFAMLSVILGAFAAHALKTKLTPEFLAILEIGTRYQMYHAFALIITGILQLQLTSQNFSAAGWFFLVGTLLFSGSLYALALTGIKTLGAITPLGGVFFLIGWATLVIKIASA